MPNERWKFLEEPWYEQKYQSIKIVALDGEQRYICLIRKSIINDYHGTEDTDEAALDNYKKNSDLWNSLVIQCVTNGKMNSDGYYYISKTDSDMKCNRFV